MDQPSPWVARFAGLIPAGEVLDLACGSGRHARLLASLGHPVLALDRDAQALAAAAGPGVTTLQHDLETEPLNWPFESERFSGIVVTNYLHRPLMAKLLASLAPGGVLIYETFAIGNEVFGKPSNPAFLLADGELLAYSSNSGLRVIAYEHGVTSFTKPALVQRLCACGPGFAPLGAHLSAESRQE
ncbi:MAG: class I SAM-dependent methyltransferase [Pseudomonadota bacterium]